MEHLHSGHRERLKGRFLQEGLDHFEEHSILELILFYAIPRKDTNAIAHQLIHRFGSLAGVLDAPVEELRKVKGVGDSAALLLTMLPELCRVYMSRRYSQEGLLNTASKLGEYFRYQFVGRKNETAMLLCLDNRCKPLGCEIVGEGGLQSVDILPRRIAEAAMRTGATAVALAHNHPRGAALPSSKDIEMTKELYSILLQIGIHLLDHIVVAGEDYYSLADAGAIPYRLDL